VVEDGVSGVDEVDYQQSKILNAHWEGFFDRESGVLFYQYGYDTKPIDASAFTLEASGNVRIENIGNLLCRGTLVQSIQHNITF
jgi:hypothetical protein